MNEIVRSPCVHICILDDEDVCQGCFRTGEEIAGWGRMSADGKREVLARSAEREQASVNFIPVTPVSR